MISASWTCDFDTTFCNDVGKPVEFNARSIIVLRRHPIARFSNKKVLTFIWHRCLEHDVPLRNSCALHNADDHFL